MSAVVNWFQFQIGAIGSSDPRPRTTVLPLFQFQIGAIGSTGTNFIYVNSAKFQFQIGAIGRSDGPLYDDPLKVSIPDWCDW